jgi:hypothetical protein
MCVHAKTVLSAVRTIISTPKILFFHAKLLQQHFWDPLHQNLCIADLLSKNSSTMMACPTLSAACYAIA